jgi:transposase
MEEKKHLKKAFMWYKVKELFEKGLNKSQISIEVGIHRKTVRKYLSMREEDFYTWLCKTRNLPKKLNEYYEYVRQLLEAHPYLSASQIEDRLKEDFSELPVVHSKTIYNFVQSIRNRHGIKKNKERPLRQYHKLPEPDYGHQAQVDFGQYQMQTKGGNRKRIYFFVMVLCRSRQKFAYFQSTPFTSTNTVDAHDRAFLYFGGQPKEIIYDQDRVLIIEENLGDALLTQEFHTYCTQMDFKTIFCRKSDPESKGKVENVVGFIKNNFLRGRLFFGEEELNKSALSWLLRTGNGKEHSGTKKIPFNEWEIERNYLQPLKHLPTKSGIGLLPKYKVRKDNTINYKSNFYTLPLGTYQGPETWVLLKEYEKEIRLYTTNNELLTLHPLCLQRGMVIRNSDHSRDKSQSILKLKEEILQMLPDQEKGLMFIEMLYKDKPRYFRDNLLALKKQMPDLDKNYLIQALTFCVENNLYNSNRLIEVARHYQHEFLVQHTKNNIIPEIMIKHGLDALDMVPQKSKLSTYETIL